MLSEGPVYGANGEKRTGTYATTLYTAPKGNLVFNAGDVLVERGAVDSAGFPEPAAQGLPPRTIARIQRITKNILDRMIKSSPSPPRRPAESP